ncbi:ANTAR domain-containing response regulator [Rhizobium sullae]|uniref:ANTAR domain-containing protein n=1 Tax=Rhizobium sullae TaxID=50338 RepID=A0A2N0DH22_RHISU|nr:ANTAR domain-containing protein [Rhizobium sullae]PKA45415.1 ANTAR domain-containing protein [Rhizobium sullae]UWU18561.1 ANTAR domain-containing protein [Rhizobium sullae]
MRDTPNFTGWHVAVIHREDGNTERLMRQLRLLGIRSTQQWAPLSAAELPDLVIVDADQGWDDLLPWNGAVPCPVVALLGSEAPGRIAWALQQGAGAIIAKPIATSAVYPALVMAVSIHEERKQAAAQLRYLEERVRLRPLVHAAVEKLMSVRAIDEERAYAILRDCAMRRRLPMEQIAAFILGGAEPLPEAG